MFSRANIFNGPIGGWDISGVTDLTLMFFSANVFNQDISSWDVSNVTQFDGMFSSASAFNQNIGGWNVSSSTNMDSMFGNALAFDQNIGSWNVRNVTDFNDFMLGKSPSNFSATNLDAIYNGWSALPSLQSSVTASFGNINYTAAGAAGRNTLVTTYNWLITDGGQI